MNLQIDRERDMYIPNKNVFVPGKALTWLYFHCRPFKMKLRFFI